MNEHWSTMPVVRGFDSVKDIYAASKGHGYISGSYAAFMAAPIMTPILPNDVDVFAVSDKAALYIHNFLINRKGWDLDAISSIAYTLSHKRRDFTVQIVKPNPAWKTFPDDFMAAFDMDVCRAVLLSPTEVLADANVGDLWGKLLLINDPLRSLKRVMKYHKRGVQFLDRELIKLFEAWELATPERRADILAMAQGTKPDPEEPSYPVETNSDSWEYDEDDYYRGE